MAEKVVAGDLFLRQARESVSSLDSDKLSPVSPEAGGEESSDSEGEQEGSSHKLIRKVSTSGQMRSKKSVKEGLLLKQTSSFQRWKRRYFKLRGRTLYYAKDAKSLIFDEVDLSDASVAESSTKNINNSFTVITPFRKLILCAENRKEMEDWIGALKSVQKWEIHEATQFNMEHFSGMHNWYACSHARPTFCNVCREALSGVTSHGLSCEVCKFKAHKRCAVRATNNCKWTTLASIGTEIIEDEDGVAMPHQWLEGNLPVSARCAVCDRACGSVRRLQDWRCLWCKAIVHSACKELFGKRCPLGQYKVSIIPPTALNSIDSDGFWKATCPSTCSSPLLAFVNSKSGDNQGVKFLRKFKQFLNPAQVFDLMNGGPHLGLRLFQKFSTFRILVCGGDGSVGWVLSEIDALGLHKQCQLGVLPLGTGNDLARVLGWGSLCDDDTQLLQILEKLERATTKMLDRWSVMTYEAPKQSPPALKEEEDGDSNIQAQISHYADSVAFHLAKILESDKHSVVISSAKFLCGTVNDFVAEVGRAYKRATENKQEAELMARKCAMLNEKLDSLVRELTEEAQAAVVPEGMPQAGPADAKELEKGGFNPSPVPRIFKSKEQLMLRANSLKKALRQIIEQAEKAVDEQNKQTQAYRASTAPSKKDSSEELNKEERLCKAPLWHATWLFFLGGGQRGEPWDGLIQQQPPPARLPAGDGELRHLVHPPGAAGHLRQPAVPRGAQRAPLLGEMRHEQLLRHRPGCQDLPGVQQQAGRAPQEVQQPHQEHDVVRGAGHQGAAAAHLQEPGAAGAAGVRWGAHLAAQPAGHRRAQHPQLRRGHQFLGRHQGGQQLRSPLVRRQEAGGGGRLRQHPDGRVAGHQPAAPPHRPVPRGEDHHPRGRGRPRAGGRRSLDPAPRRHQDPAQEPSPDADQGPGEPHVPGRLGGGLRGSAGTVATSWPPLQAFESTLKSWEDKQKGESYRAAARPRLSSQQSMEYLTEEESSLLQQLSRAAESLIARIHEAAKAHKAVEQELAHAVNTSALALSEALSNKAAGAAEFLSRNAAVEVVLSIKALYAETRAFLEGKALDSPQEEEALQGPLSALGQELQRLLDIHWLVPIAHPAEEESGGSANKGSFKLRLNIPKPRKDKAQKQKANSALPADKWGAEEVAAWLEALGLGEYRDIFIRHDIQGSELILLERRDLKDLGITKVGHMKRILQAIKELSNPP
uniref:diacylglycerol kinase (ATP) n=1 Tax=Cairina moschata TaxID=8855 RepID=A0A8C3B830_CAIMO